MTKRIALLILLALAGCGKPKPIVNQPKLTAAGEGYVIGGPIEIHGAISWSDQNTFHSNNEVLPLSHEAQVYAELWALCKEKHLKYTVNCWKGDGCNAQAWDNKYTWWQVYIDKPWYASHTDPPSDPTRAVELLIQLIKGGHPNDQLAGPHSEHEFDTGEVTPQ